jgi:hypothetical protein
VIDRDLDNRYYLYGNSYVNTRGLQQPVNPTPQRPYTLVFLQLSLSVAQL